MNPLTRFLDYTFIALAIVFGFGSVLLLVVVGLSGFIHFGWSERDILLWDAFLSLVFFVQHSGMIRRSFRNRLAKVVSPLYLGAIYTIASGIALALVVILWQKSETLLFVLQGIPRLITTMCVYLAIIISILGAYALRTFDPLGIGPIRARLQGIDHTPAPFVVRGPYRWVRHPLYLCVLLLLWAKPDVTADRLLFNLLWSGWTIVATLLEERDLRRQFGDVYGRYQKFVPMLIPWRGPAAKTTLDQVE